uniref:Uncharacterized protein n=1 Tax=Anguilla anguilla TaxID=7936 RepID=A0A0E9QT40_ANGAN
MQTKLIFRFKKKKKGIYVLFAEDEAHHTQVV